MFAVLPPPGHLAACGLGGGGPIYTGDPDPCLLSSLLQVVWRPVVWGISLQFILGVIILRWTPGYHFFRFMGDQVKVFLDYTDEGSKFVFGEEGYLMHRMAFKVSKEDNSPGA